MDAFLHVGAAKNVVVEEDPVKRTDEGDDKVCECLDEDTDIVAEEDLEEAVEDMQTSYEAIVTHLNKCIGGLKEMKVAKERGMKVMHALERASTSVVFGSRLLEELEKLDAAVRLETVTTHPLSNGHLEPATDSSSGGTAAK